MSSDLPLRHPGRERASPRAAPNTLAGPRCRSRPRHLPAQTSPQHLTAEGTPGLLWARTDAAHQHPTDNEDKVYSARGPSLEHETSETFSWAATRTSELCSVADNQNRTDSW